MITRDPDASFDTPNVVIGRQGRNELTLSFRPAPYLHRLLAAVATTCVGDGGALSTILTQNRYALYLPLRAAPSAMHRQIGRTGCHTM